MPLRRLYRLGATPQRVRKGYLLAGAPEQVDRFRRSVAGRVLDGGIAVHAPSDRPRVVVLDSGWVWLHDEVSRRRLTDGLTAAVLGLSGEARRTGCALVPGAVRPPGETGWADWVVGDEHEVAVTDDVEREVACNLLRDVVPVLIALTGRAGISTAVEPLGSRRLAESSEHLATRYLASTSARHLSQVERELRRTTGIKSLRSMDVHPLGDDPPQPFSGSVVVRCVDAQAFVGSAVAHAVLVQAAVMSARRRARGGRRVGNTPQRLLERQREMAILHGLDARVPTEAPAGRDRAAGAAVGPRATLASLAEDLIAELTPELGTLEVGFRELAPVTALLVADPSVPRTENELFARFPGEQVARPDTWAAVVGDPHRHRPDALLSAGHVDLGSVATLAGLWEQSLTEPPPPTAGQVGTRPAANGRAGGQRGPGRASRQAPDRPAGTHGAARPAHRSTHGRQDSRGTGQAAREPDVRRLAGLPQDSRVDPAFILGEVARMDGPDTELLPWLGEDLRDHVSQARRLLRPPGPQRVQCTLGGLRVDAPEVRWAQEQARRHGVALITIDVGSDEEPSARRAVAALVAATEGDQRVVLLGTSRFRCRDGDALLRLELLVVREDGA